MRLPVPILVAAILTASAAALAGDGAVVQVLDRIARTQRRGRYTHATRVVEREGRFEWDCSAMASWVLASATPAAQRAVVDARRATRPLARDYHAFASTLPAGRPSGPLQRPWQRIVRLVDAQPGDVIAWVFPPWVRADITGHVGFVLARPVPVPGDRRRFRLRIADSTSVPHIDDTRRAGGTSGFGAGTIELVADARTGAPVAYRWNDQPGRGTLRTSIVIARPLR